MFKTKVHGCLKVMLHCARISAGAFSCVAYMLLCAGLAKATAQNNDHSASVYHLHVNDVLQVSFHLTPELDTSVTIQPDGFATLPNIGMVKLLNLTLGQATSAITAQASERLNAPEITVTLKDFERPQFFVGGEVGRPGKYPLNEPISPIQAVQDAGGLKDTGSATHVLLLHPIGDGVAETRIIDLKHAGQQGNMATSLLVQSGDILIVRENNFTKVSRFVKLINPGVYVPLN